MGLRETVMDASATTAGSAFGGYYSPTAYDSTRPRNLAQGDKNNFGFLERTVRRTTIPNFGTPQCREFISDFSEDGVIEWCNSGKKETLDELKKPYFEVQYWETLRNPRAVIEVFTKLMLLFSVLTWGGVVFFLLIFLFIRPAFFFSPDFLVFIALPSLFLVCYTLGTYALKNNLFKNKNNVLFNRRFGTISIPRKKKEPLIIPFDEFDPILGSTVNPSGSVDYHLILAHRFTSSLVQHPNGSMHKWKAVMEMEYLLQYMDISSPLPDVPSMEPFRLKDPVTAEHDRMHNRPERFWRDMDPETFKKMHDASYKAAKNYPWGKTREEAIASGWQPSPFNEDNLKALYQKPDIESVL